MEDFRILTYSKRNLEKCFFVVRKHLLRTVFSEYRLLKSARFDYFLSYFKNIEKKPKTILIEFNYIDHDFLIDYSHYYSRCYLPYHRLCSRIHFFTEGFTKKKFLDVLENSENNPGIFNKYLGFIVVKPLPKTFIGKTCISTYESSPEYRYFPRMRKYKASLFGVNLETNDTIAFQEQDSEVSACATSALWSIFQITGINFGHHIPSPVEITLAAHKGSPDATRAIPNKGLNALQMSSAIRSVGLEPHYEKFLNMSVFKSTVYAYLSANIPILLGIKLVNKTDTEDELVGYHAVTIVGFGMEEKSSKKREYITLYSDRINRIYVHDDQIGPFSKMEMHNWQLSTTWQDQHNNVGNVYADPMYVILPLYNKIRIQKDVIINKAYRTHDLFIYISRLCNYSKDEMELEVLLTNISEFKSWLRKNSVFPEMQKIRTLVNSFPKYVWLVRCRYNGRILIDLVYDATDIGQGQILLTPLFYDRDVLQGAFAIYFNDEAYDGLSHESQHVLKMLVDGILKIQ